MTVLIVGDEGPRGALGGFLPCSVRRAPGETAAYSATRSRWVRIPASAGGWGADSVSPQDACKTAQRAAASLTQSKIEAGPAWKKLRFAHPRIDQDPDHPAWILDGPGAEQLPDHGVERLGKALQ